MARVFSSTSPLTGETLASHINNNSNNKRVSEYEFPTAVKVDLPYQSYLNHPYNQQSSPNRTSQPHSQIQKPQAYVSKYNSYTNSSKTMRLITIPSSTSAALSAIEKAKGGRLNDDLMNSPTSPLVSPPPPYLHSEQSEFKFGGFTDKKNKQQQRQSVQWPSMMQISSATGATTATLTRPKLAKMPPQAIPINIGGADEIGSVKAPLSPRISRLMESGESETLYNLQMSDDHHHIIGTTTSTISASTTMLHPYNATTLSYPTFWQDARQTKMHWAFLSIGCVALGSAIWVLVMQAFIIEWAVVMPAATLGLLALQFGRYRWKRSKHVKQRNEQAACMQPKDTTTTTTTLRSIITQQRDSDAFLGPHQPRDYYQAATYQQQQQQQTTRSQHVTFQDSPPSPTSSTTTESHQFNQQLHKQPRLSQMAKKPSSNNQQQRRPLTVNPGLYRATVGAGATAGSPTNQVNNGSPYYQNPQFLSPVESPQTPPPAYFLKKIELPEIDSVGDLVSEFECDLGSIRY
ncbi:hypothetical protein K457DRAFT_121630 [Linnemannia elongata AG-77]|uniref:Uncharacterized protein n=1 Tax=Linnemannia elongata AG-77 TaxID=1314771 RepID=A0A197KCP3_9FUNG|nr:hypothetical protein K457DRAFT_121630 [Linnemannia elongata AG-77]